MIAISDLAPPVAKRYEVSGYSLEKTAKLMKLSFSRLLHMHPEIDITVDQWVILQLVFKYREISQQELCDLAFKDAPTVTRIIDLLASKSLVTREAHPSDRRKFIITITEAGLAMHNQVKPILTEFRLEAYDGITDQELETLEHIMSKIFVNLSKQN
jgi:DNA-binding MarR family transcriptional regulator